MFDEEPEEQPTDDDAATDEDGALDMGEMAAPVETADEPAVSPDELAEIPDAPSRWEGGELTAEGPAETSKLRAQDAAEAGAQAAAADAGGAEPENRATQRRWGHGQVRPAARPTRWPTRSRSRRTPTRVRRRRRNSSAGQPVVRAGTAGSSAPLRRSG